SKRPMKWGFRLMRDFWKTALIFGGGGFRVWKVLMTPPGGKRAPYLTVRSSLIRYADKGDDARAVQTALTSLGYSPGNIDGIFGPLTNEAVRRFQSDQRIAVDGIVGPETIAALNVELMKYGGSFVLANGVHIQRVTID